MKTVLYPHIFFFLFLFKEKCRAFFLYVTRQNRYLNFHKYTIIFIFLKNIWPCLDVAKTVRQL